MEQKPLTTEQHEILKKLESVFREAKQNGIMFVADNADLSLTAFNGKNVIDYYCDYGNEEGKKFEWELAYVVKNIEVEIVNSNVENLFLEFESETD